MMKVKALVMRVVLAAALSAAGAGSLFAQDGRAAFIRDLAGTVEVKAPRADTWTAAYRGQQLDIDMLISTGFKSTAVIVLGNSVLTVRPLTRLSLTELSRVQDNEKVEFRLQTGRVRAEVKAQAAGQTDFTVRSSAATASVRGTVFEFDTLSLSVSEGAVEFSGAAGTPVVVDAGRVSSVVPGDAGGGLRPQAASEAVLAELRPDLPSAAESALPAAVTEVLPGPAVVSEADVGLGLDF
jgi:hypothetical protein